MPGHTPAPGIAPIAPTDPASIAFYRAILLHDIPGLRRQLEANPQLVRIHFTERNVCLRKLIGVNATGLCWEGYSRDIQSLSPVIIAAVAGDLPTLDELLRAGADPFETDACGCTAVKIALTSSRNYAVAQRLYDLGVPLQTPQAPFNLLHEELYEVDFARYKTDPHPQDLLIWLLEHGANMNTTSSMLQHGHPESGWDLLTMFGFYTEFLDYDWSDQPRTEILYHIHRTQPQIPGWLQLTVFAAVLLLLGWRIRRTQRRAAALAAAAQTGGDPLNGLSPATRRRLEKFQARLAAERLPLEPLAALRPLHRQADRLRRWSALPLAAGILATASVAADPLLPRMPHTLYLWIFAAALLGAGLLQIFTAPLLRLLSAVALAGLALIGAPAIAYQGYLMTVHFRCAAIGALDVATAGALLALCLIAFQQLRTQWRLWRGESSLLAALRQAHRAEDETHMEAPSNSWDPHRGSGRG